MPCVATATNRRWMLRTTSGLAALLVLAAGMFADPPAARAYDDTYFQWCIRAVGEGGYCCNKAGGIWDGSNCYDAIPSATPTYQPPNNGFLVP